jgi:hypothetical protein
MANLQDILNQFSKSDTAKLRTDKLVPISKRRQVYEYNSEGKVINTFKSITHLRKSGIRIERETETIIITKDNRIFSLNGNFTDFDFWYKKRKNQIARGIIQYTTDNKFIKEWDCLVHVERELGISRGNLKRYFNQGPLNKFGKIRTVGGFVWVDKKLK